MKIISIVIATVFFLSACSMNSQKEEVTNTNMESIISTDGTNSTMVEQKVQEGKSSTVENPISL